MTPKITDIEYHAPSRMLYASASNLMGTRLDVVIIGVSESEARNLWSECLQTAIELERSVSLYSPDSETSTINRAEPLSVVHITPLYSSLLTMAADMHRLTNGTFDITLGQGSEFIFTSDGELIIPSSGMKIDMGGLAKGVAVNSMVTTMSANPAIKGAFINFGGSSIAGIGAHPKGDCWRVGIRDPFSGQILRDVDLRNASLSTSGNSTALRGHIINPATGHAVTGRRLSAVVAPSAIDAEVLSTAWLIADEDTRLDILKNFDVQEEFVFN